MEIRIVQCIAWLIKFSKSWQDITGTNLPIFSLLYEVKFLVIICVHCLFGWSKFFNQGAYCIKKEFWSLLSLLTNMAYQSFISYCRNLKNNFWKLILLIIVLEKSSQQNYPWLWYGYFFTSDVDNWFEIWACTHAQKLKRVKNMLTIYMHFY